MKFFFGNSLKPHFSFKQIASLLTVTLFHFLFINANLAQAELRFWLCSDGNRWILTENYPTSRWTEETAYADCQRKTKGKGFTNDCVRDDGSGAPTTPCNSAEMKPYTVSCCKQNKDGVNTGVTGVINENVQASSPQQAIAIVQSKYAFIGSCSTDKIKTNDECSGLGLPEPPKDPFNIDILNPGSANKIISGMNPLTNGGGLGGKCSGNLTIGCILGLIINEIIFPLAVIFFALMIVWGGYKIVAGGMSGSQNQVSAGKQRLIGAILGLLLLASVYWIWQLIEYLTNIKVVG